MYYYNNIQQLDLKAASYNPAVPLATLQCVFKWRTDGQSMQDVIDRLRAKTVPAGHPFHKWKQDSM